MEICFVCVSNQKYIFSGQYKPTASELNSALPSNNQIPTNGITSGGAPGFVYGTLRIRELTGKHDYVETFGYTPDPTNTPNITNSIPTVIVWIDDHNTFHSNPYNVRVRRICPNQFVCFGTVIMTG